MTSSMLRRQLKNLVQNYSEAEVKVREATSNDPWGPSSSQMADISDLTYNAVACSEIMTMLWKRLKDDRNWRHIHKVKKMMRNSTLKHILFVLLTAFFVLGEVIV
uniref:ENTH domain-containing protein n=1 Tax=Poecilia reticulata TaxID=8081 RepID=A0A3P9MU38_POERE